MKTINGTKLPKSLETVWRIMTKISQGTSFSMPVWKIAKKANLSERSVQTAIRKLTELGVMKWTEQMVKDHVTKRMKSVANKYEILLDFTLKNLALTGCKFAHLKDSIKRSFKRSKELKREDAKAITPLPQVASTQNTYVKKHKSASIPTTAEQVKKAMAPIIDQFNPLVVQHVIQLYGKLLPTGHIGSPLGWIRGALVKEQARYNKFGFFGMIKRSKSMLYTNFLKAGGYQPEEHFWPESDSSRRFQAF